MNVVTIERNVLAKNDELAERNRQLLQLNAVFCVNLISSPGSGKTSILERTIERLKGTRRIAVVEGDVQTDIDAQRIAEYGIPAVQIVTRGGCHLEANLVAQALEAIDLAVCDLLIIENVGNLVCPASYDLGEAHKVVVISTTEGEDKPLKYPEIFRRASAVIINKTDLLPYLNCNMAVLRENILSVNPHVKLFETSCTTGGGIDIWCHWLASHGGTQ